MLGDRQVCQEKGLGTRDRGLGKKSARTFLAKQKLKNKVAATIGA